MQLSIIIVSYNVKYFLEQCLCSVKAALSNINAEVLVIDNCSADNSIGYLQPYFPWVTFISNTANEGFAKANNKALATAKGEYVLFLNPDTLLAEDTLQQCINFFLAHTDAGAVGARMIDGSGRFLPESKRSFPSPSVAFYKLAGLSGLFPASRLFNKYALSYLPQNEVHQVDVLSGAFMMVRKKLLESIGGFDEQFFMYAEDIDLSFRIQQTRSKNYYIGTTTIVHFKGESTAKGNLNYVRLFYGAMQLFVQKYYYGAGAWIVKHSLQAGIMFRGLLAAIVLPFKMKNQNSSAALRQVYTIGDKVQAASAAEIISRQYSAASIKHINELPETAGKYNCAILFCTGDYTYKEAIQAIQMAGTTISILWSGKETRSIVGSSDKNKSGFAWSNSNEV